MNRQNRRGFLLGAGACTIAGLVAATADLELRPGDRRGPGLRKPQQARPAARTGVTPAHEISGYLDSRFTKARMGWTISVPRTTRTRRPLAIVYCLHGYHSDHRMAFDQIHLPQVAAAIGLPVVVAAVDGGQDSYWHRRAEGTAGRPTQRFHAVAPASPALWLTPGATAPGAFDSPADFYANDIFAGVSSLRTMKVAVFCGNSDPFYDATRHLVDLMDYPREASFAPGGHDDVYWRSVAPAQLRAIGAARGISEGPKHQDH